MRIVFLFLFAGYFVSNQVPVVSNYSDFIAGIQKSEPTAMRMSSSSIRYGTTVHNDVYQEILPIDETHVLLVKEAFETIPEHYGSESEAAKGESYVCLCRKDDLVSILQRWKDGQYGVNDYAEFDCKYRNLTNRAEMFDGDSFWQSINLTEKLSTLQDVEHVALSGKAKLLVFRNRNNPSKKILKISFDLPMDQVVKEVEAESFLTSVKGDDGTEMYRAPQALGWKSLFPEWKDYKPLNTGFWGVPKRKKSVLNNRFSKSYSIVSSHSAKLNVKGQTTFLVKTEETKSNSLNKLTLKKDDHFVKSEKYLDFGEYIRLSINGLSNDNQHVLVAVQSDVPILSVVAYDARTGAKIGTADTLPLELNLPISTTEINLDVVYTNLKKVCVEYTITE